MRDLLRESIAQVCGVDVSTLGSDTRLADIGVDSLASAEVIVDLEIRIGKQFPVGTLRSLEHVRTIADVAALLERALATAQPSGTS